MASIGTRPTDREIVSTRVFDAPRERVFRAFSDPRVLARWWGPDGFTSTFQEFDFRPGGAWRFVMHGPDGADYRNESAFIEVVSPERIVLEHLRPMHRFLMTMTFAEEAGKTRLTWRLEFESVAERERVRAFIPAANEQNLDRLQAQLAVSISGSPDD
jgi:uncharacterized protein YndB with AHSA1/START domain